MTGQVAGHIGRPRPPIARNLRAEMERTEMSAEEVAVAIGARERMVRRWAHENEVNPGWTNLVKLAKLFDREPSWFYEEREAA